MYGSRCWENGAEFVSWSSGLDSALAPSLAPHRAEALQADGTIHVAFVVVLAKRARTRSGRSIRPIYQVGTGSASKTSAVELGSGTGLSYSRRH